MITLQIIWFVLLLVLFSGYAVLDGFDLGIGFWHLFEKNPEQKKHNMSAISPFWDGNEVWLLAAGGSIFAAFSPVYASVFSGFYIFTLLIVVGLIFRATSLEFRNKKNSPIWQKRWDLVFSFSSLLVPFLLGVVTGNLVKGIPLNDNGDFVVGYMYLLNPYGLFWGLIFIVISAGHGAIFLGLKFDKKDGLKSNAMKSWAAALILLIIADIWSWIFYDYLFDNFLLYKSLLLIPFLFLCLIFLLFYFLKKLKFLAAFLCSSLMIILLIFSIGMSMFPNLVRSSNNLELSLNIFNSSSSFNTLLAMLIIVLIGMPFVIFYTAWVYRVFKGKPDNFKY